MYRMVECETWDDPWFSDLAPDAKLLFLYLLTNRRSTTCGAFEVTVRYMAFDTGIEASRIEQLIASFHPRVSWWPDLNIVWLRNFYRHQKGGPTFEKNARSVVRELPAEVRQEIGKVYPVLVTDEDTLSVPHAYPMDRVGAPLRIVKEKEELKKEGERADETAADAAPPPQSTPIRSAPKSEKRQATKIPVDWQPSPALLEWATEKDWPDDFIRYEAEQFVDYWRGSGGTKVDWDATFRTWVRNAAPGGKFGASSTNGTRPGRTRSQAEINKGGAGMVY